MIAANSLEMVGMNQVDTSIMSLAAAAPAGATISEEFIEVAEIVKAANNDDDNILTTTSTESTTATNAHEFFVETCVFKYRK